eukprot:scaffold114425_cov51-Phaeocystis_antarctica.AAC.2
MRSAVAPDEVIEMRFLPPGPPDSSSLSDWLSSSTSSRLSCSSSSACLSSSRAARASSVARFASASASSTLRWRPAAFVPAEPAMPPAPAAAFSPASPRARSPRSATCARRSACSSCSGSGSESSTSSCSASTALALVFRSRPSFTALPAFWSASSRSSGESAISSFHSALGGAAPPLERPPSSMKAVTEEPSPLLLRDMSAPHRALPRRTYERFALSKRQLGAKAARRGNMHGNTLSDHRCLVWGPGHLRLSLVQMRNQTAQIRRRVPWDT